MYGCNRHCYRDEYVDPKTLESSRNVQLFNLVELLDKAKTGKDQDALQPVEKDQCAHETPVLVLDPIVVKLLIP